MDQPGLVEWHGLIEATGLDDGSYSLGRKTRNVLGIGRTHLLDARGGDIRHPHHVHPGMEEGVVRGRIHIRRQIGTRQYRPRTKPRRDGPEKRSASLRLQNELGNQEAGRCIEWRLLWQ